jgi:hypothetical protein
MEASITLKNTVKMVMVVHSFFICVIFHRSVDVFKTAWFQSFCKREQHPTVVAISVHMCCITCHWTIFPVSVFCLGGSCKRLLSFALYLSIVHKFPATFIVSQAIGRHVKIQSREHNGCANIIQADEIIALPVHEL